MKKEGQLKLIKILTYILLIVSTLYFIFIGNYEFLIYIVVSLIFFWLIIYLDKKYDFKIYSIWLFFIWIVSHMVGGGVKIKEGGVFYAKVLIPLVGDPFFILKYDQLVHFYCYFVVAILIYQILKKNMTKSDNFMIFLICVFASLGIGALNEIVEFTAVVFVDAAKGVGGYYNNALDLVFNFIGAIAGSLWIRKRV